MCQNLIFGFGYLGRRVAARWRKENRPVCVVTRSSKTAANLSKQGYSAVVADITNRESLASLPPAETILFAVGYDRQANQSIEEVYVNGLSNVLNAISGVPGRLIYASSTGVIGDAEGGVVDEFSPCRPSRTGGRAHLAAEQLLLDSRHARNSVILRCAGLYGPGRVPRIAEVRSQTPIAANPAATLNLIHIDDAAGIVCAVASKKPPSQLYLVADGSPVRRRDFYQELARLLELPSPIFRTQDIPREDRRARGSNKRVDTTRLQSEIGYQLLYPSYRCGLAAIVATESKEQS